MDSRKTAVTKRRRVIVDLEERDDSDESVAVSVANDDDSSVDLGTLRSPSSSSEADESSLDDDEELPNDMDRMQDTLETQEKENLFGTQPVVQYSQPLKGSQPTSTPRIKRRGTPRPNKRQTPDSLLTLTEPDSASSATLPIPAKHTSPQGRIVKNPTPKKPAPSPRNRSNDNTGMVPTVEKKKKLPPKKGEKGEPGKPIKPAKNSTNTNSPKQKKPAPSPGIRSHDEMSVPTENSKTVSPEKYAEGEQARPATKSLNTTLAKALAKPEVPTAAYKASPSKEGASSVKPKAGSSKPSHSKPQQKPVKRKRKVAQNHAPPGTTSDNSKPSAREVSSASRNGESNHSDKETPKPPRNEGTKKATAEKAPSEAQETRPQKKKPKKRTFQDDVLHHMLFKCKPFSLKTLAQDLKSTETALNYVMLSLLDKKLVFKKEFATKKTTKVLYWANQDSRSKEMLALQATAQQIQDSKRELDMFQKQNLSVSKELAVALQEASNAELTDQLRKAQNEVASLETKVKEVQDRIKAPPKRPPSLLNKGDPRKSAAQLAKERCPRRIKMRINAMRQEWKTRREKCMDFVDQVADGMEKKVKDVVKLLDVETDEAEGVVMPPKYVIDPK